MEQIEAMILNDKSTLYINFAHIAEVTLSAAISSSEQAAVQRLSHCLFRLLTPCK